MDFFQSILNFTFTYQLQLVSANKIDIQTHTNIHTHACALTNTNTKICAPTKSTKLLHFVCAAAKRVNKCKQTAKVKSRNETEKNTHAHTHTRIHLHNYIYTETEGASRNSAIAAANQRQNEVTSRKSAKHTIPQTHKQCKDARAHTHTFMYLAVPLCACSSKITNVSHWLKSRQCYAYVCVSKLCVSIC